jgi:hypothetical protein
VFRWPVEFTPLSLGSQGQPRAAVLKITPRGAVFTLAALSHVGHPAHLALIDAYLKGQVRLTPSASIGEDCRLVASSVAAPLLAAFELGVQHLSLADVVLRPREPGSSLPADIAADGRPVYTADSPRLLLRAGGLWHSVHTAERFEAPGCLGTRGVGLADEWHRVIAELPSRDGVAERGVTGSWFAPILAEVRAPTGDDDPTPPDLVARIRETARGQPRRKTVLGHPLPLSPALTGPSELRVWLADSANTRLPAETAVTWRELRIDVTLSPEPDGYQTLCLLPPADADPAGLFETMRDLGWETIEGLIGRPLPERRTEPIDLRLVAENGRTVALEIGASVVIGRNQTVFAAWVGSDGRVMLKLFPPGGMPTR